MMKNFQAIFILLITTFLAGFTQPVQATSCDPILGVWLQNQKEVNDPNLTLAAQVIFNADKTCVRNIDADLQRVFGPPLFPEGTVFSISDEYAIWRRISKHRYECVGTQIVLIKNQDGTFSPLARSKCVIDMHISGDNMQAFETLSFFDYFDLTLTQPFPALPTLHFNIEGKKLRP